MSEFLHARILFHEPDGSPRALNVFDGGISTLDGVLVNGVIKRLPFVRHTGVRHRIIVDSRDEDGKPLETHIGTLNSAIRRACVMIDRHLGVIEGTWSGETIFESAPRLVGPQK